MQAPSRQPPGPPTEQSRPVGAFRVAGAESGDHARRTRAFCSDAPALRSPEQLSIAAAIKTVLRAIMSSPNSQRVVAGTSASAAQPSSTTEAVRIDTVLCPSSQLLDRSSCALFDLICNYRRCPPRGLRLARVTVDPNCTRAANSTRSLKPALGIARAMLQPLPGPPPVSRTTSRLRATLLRSARDDARVPTHPSAELVARSVTFRANRCPHQRAQRHSRVGRRHYPRAQQPAEPGLLPTSPV